MGLFPRLFATRSSKGPLDDYWYETFPVETKAGVSVTENDSLKYLAVLACVTLVAGDIAKLPFRVMKKNADGSRTTVSNHTIDHILQVAPNKEISSFNWRESKQGAHLMLWGNTYDYIIKSSTWGEIQELQPILEPGKMVVERLFDNCLKPGPEGTNRRHKKGDLIYTYDGITFRKSEIFHVPGFGYNGIVGLSPIGLAREAIGMGLAAEEFQSKFFGNGTHPSVVVTMPPGIDLGENEEAYKKNLKETISGIKNAQGLAVFSNGEKVERLTMNFDDAQYLETRIHQKSEIAAIYHVPLHKIGIHGSNSNYNNMEQENQGYVDSCLSHWASRWEQAATLQLLTEQDRKNGLYCKMELKGLLRADTQARQEHEKTLWNMGLPLNRILELEDMDPVAGGDKGFVQMNMMPLEMAGQNILAKQQNKVKPKTEQQVDPEDDDDEEEDVGE